MAKMITQLSEASDIDQANKKLVFSIVSCLTMIISRHSYKYVTEHLRIKSIVIAENVAQNLCL